MKVSVVFHPPIEEFNRRFDAHRMVDAPLRKGFKAFGDKLSDRAERYAKPHGGDQGTVGDSIETDLAGQGFDLLERVFSRNPIAEDLELGRRPGGRQPSSTVIARFLERHGGNPRYGFVVARRMARQGTRGIHFLKRAADESAKADGGAVFRDVAQEIEQNWKRG